MATIEIDVDIEDFDTEDLVNEIIYRKNKILKSSYLEELLLTFIKENCNIQPSEDTTLEEELKMEHLIQAYKKYSLQDIEKQLPI